MNRIRTLVTLFFCLCVSVLHTKNATAQKQGMFSFGITMSDYRFLKEAKDSSLNYALRQKSLFKSGNASFGMQVNYWRHLVPHIDLSGNLGWDLSNFPALFVRGDSVGQAGFTTHLDGLIHYMIFKKDAMLNPFLTAGMGAGYFGKQFAVYAPVGAGVAFHFKAGGIIILQLQMRKALSPGITNDFMFYSLGFAQAIPGTNPKKHESQKDKVIKSLLSPGPRNNSRGVGSKVEVPSGGLKTVKNLSQPAADTTVLKNEIYKNLAAKIAKEYKVSPLPDSDGDGVPDKDDKCPTVKGSVENQGCPFPMVEGAEVLNMSPDSVVYSINFEFDQSIIQTGAFAVLSRIVEILKSDKTLTIDIAGYADDQGTDYKNLQVSSDRANVTRDYFLSYDIAASRIKSGYYGSSNPIDKVQQWRNRRVEITIIKN